MLNLLTLLTILKQIIVQSLKMLVKFTFLNNHGIIISVIIIIMFHVVLLWKKSIKLKFLFMTKILTILQI